MSGKQADQIDGGFSDIRVADSLFGFPELVALDAETFIVSDWSGVLRKVDCRKGTVATSPSFAILDGTVGNELRSLCVANTVKNLVGVATRAPYAAIWDWQADSIQQVHSESGEKVNAVAFASDGKHLVLGTGFYPLDSRHHVEAKVEVWSHKGKWVLEMIAALPGVCVDWVGWHETANILVALTGRRTQDGGYVSVLDSSTLRPLRVAVRSGRVGYAGGIQEWPVAAAVFGESFEMFHLEDSNENDWNFTPKQSLKGACLVDDQILTTSGDFVCSSTGEMQDQISPLDSCCQVIARPGGGFAGISKDGVLRVWEEPE